LAKDTQPDVTGSIEPVPEDDEINLSNEVKSLSEIEDVLGKNLPPKEAQHVLSVVQSHLFSGPLPPPESIAGYEKVLPGSADIWQKNRKIMRIIVKAGRWAFSLLLQSQGWLVGYS